MVQVPSAKPRGVLGASFHWEDEEIGELEDFPVRDPPARPRVKSGFPLIIDATVKTADGRLLKGKVRCYLKEPPKPKN